MIARFFAPLADASGTVVALPDFEAAHLTRVLRLTAGAPVRVFDGRGREWQGEVATADRGRATVRLIDTVAPAPEPRIAIGLALSVLKGDKMDDVIRDAVMLGVASITPLATSRTEIALSAIVKSQRVDRWHRIAVSSAKQCGRAVVPTIDPPVALDALLAARRETPRAMLIEPGAATRSAMAVRDVPRTSAIDLIVGPEGGWTLHEVAAADASGCMLVTLAAGTLRADAVPLVAITAIRALWQDL